MNNIKYLTLIFFLINSCSSIKLDCKPEVRDFFYHTNSSVCMFQIGDTVSERYMNTRNLYDTIIPFNSCFIIDGDNIVFEYNYHAKQCITEPYWQYFLFQIPSYLDKEFYPSLQFHKLKMEIQKNYFEEQTLPA